MVIAVLITFGDVFYLPLMQTGFQSRNRNWNPAIITLVYSTPTIDIEPENDADMQAFCVFNAA
jgi:hypothetical protein